MSYIMSQVRPNVDRLQEGDLCPKPVGPNFGLNFCLNQGLIRDYQFSLPLFKL